MKENLKIGDIVKPVKTDPDKVIIFEEWEILTDYKSSDGDFTLFECVQRSDGNWDLLWGPHLNSWLRMVV